MYLCFSLLWIALSDRLLLSFTREPETIALISNIKGFFFVTLSALLIYTLIHRKIREKNEIIAVLDREVAIREELIRELHHRIKNNLQVVISLINLESAAHLEREDFIASINDKLHSMIAVFNVVYNFKDMRNIALDRVLEEYTALSSRRLSTAPHTASPALSVETITSLMLVVESLSAAWCANPACTGGVSLAITAPNRLHIQCDKPAAALDIAPEDRDFIDLELSVIAGSLELSDDGSGVTIVFTAT